jgi:hypothetical protein
VLKDQLPHYRLARGNTKSDGYCRATDPASRASEIDIFEVSDMLQLVVDQRKRSFSKVTTS